MWWAIVRKEIVSNLLSYKFFVVILLIVILTFTCFFVMYRDYKTRLADYDLIKPKPGEPIAVLSPNPLSIFAKGLDDAMTRSFEISRFGITVRAGKQSGNVIFSFFPSPDFLYIVRVVLSLVALLFGFDQVSGEKERETLSLMVSNSVSRGKIITGKWTGNFFSLSIPFLLVTALGFAFMNFDSDIRFQGHHLARLGLIILLSLLYTALFLSIGIFISSVTKKAAVSLVILLLLWAILVFIIPNLGTLLARQMVSVPSVRALSEKKQQIWTREVLLLEMERRANKDIDIDRIFKSHFQTIAREQDQLEEDYRNKFNRLVRISKNINRISPVASLAYGITDIAGTGVAEEAHLMQEVIKYKNTVLENLLAEKKEHQAFRYMYRSLGKVFAEGSLFDIAWIFFLNLLVFILSYFAFVRYDVR
jgi:ABC-type transport system involved in multi-copper enzyme maturation permease subunit